MTHKDREEERQWDDRGRGWANVATSQRVPAAFRAGGEWEQIFLIASEVICHPIDILVSGL